MVRCWRGLCVALVALAAVWISGCSGRKIKTYPVAGKVALSDGDVSQLAGSLVEIRQEADPLLRASGPIAADGSFNLETLFEGVILKGAPEGKYQARIVLGDESDEGAPKRKGKPVHRRFMDFETSQLSFQVPGGDYSLTLSRK